MKTLAAVLGLVVLSGCWHGRSANCAQSAAATPPPPQVIVVTVPPGSTVVTPQK